MRFSRCQLCLALFICFLLLQGAAQAAPQAEVVLGKHVVFRVEKPEVAEKISKRIEQQLQAGMTASDIRVEVKAQDKDLKKHCIYWGSQLVIAISPEMAKSYNSEPQALADLWAESMREVVAIGLLNLDLNSCTLALDLGPKSSKLAPVERVVTTSGLSTGQLKAVDTTGRVEVKVDEAAGTVTLRGKGLGKSVVKVTKGKGSQVIAVHVKDDAGTLPKSVEIEVTGSPALATAVEQAAYYAVLTAAVSKPGCHVFIDEEGVKPVNVPSGDHLRLGIPVGITGGENYFAVRGEVSVLAKNVPLEAVESNLLLVSNRPERVNVDGILLSYTFRRKEPTRLMYSHLNESSDKRNLWVNLYNNGDKPIRIMIGWSGAGPERSEVHVGQTSAKRFLENLGAQSGFIVSIKPHSGLEIAAHEMKPQALVTGFVNFHILEGENATVEVRTQLAPSQNDGSSLPAIGAPFNPFKIHPHGVFAQPFFEYEAEHVVGKEPVAFRYGESPWLIDFETGLPNTGNFGVLYKALVGLKNPFPTTRQVGVYFTPLSGPGGANFLINGEVFQAKFRKMGDEVLVAIIELPARCDNQVEIITFPEASSCYPAQFELRDYDGDELSPDRSLPSGESSSHTKIIPSTQGEMCPQ